MSHMTVLNKGMAIFIGGSIAILSGCAPQSFAPAELQAEAPGEGTLITPITPPPIDSNNPVESKIANKTFSTVKSELKVVQERLDQNSTSVQFQVVDGANMHINNLVNNDITVSENGVAIPNFTLRSTSQTLQEPVDIVFAVDITYSMRPSIESAKTRLINFVRSSRAQGHYTRMCLLTFGDYTVRNCNRFYENNPSDPSTQTQVDELISEITKLSAARTITEDPGGSTRDENPMRALIDASNAPWTNQSQRFVILMTDAGFLVTPNNMGGLSSAVVPRYSQVQRAIQNSGMKVFAVTPSLAGYNQRFTNTEVTNASSVVALSGGEHFLFSDLVAGRITIDTILGRIMRRVQTTYTLSYVVDEIVGLDPTLGLEQRNIRITANDAGQRVINLTRQSNLPTGRRPYAKKWVLSAKPVKAESMECTVNGAPCSDVALVDGFADFRQAPLPGSEITFKFEHAKLEDSLQIEPILLHKDVSLSQIYVTLNGKKALAEHLIVSKNLEGHNTIVVAPSVLSEADPFEIRKKGGKLEMDVFFVQKR